MSGQITVVGSSNVDFIMRVERLPKPGETVTNGKFAQVYGGKGANQATAAARAGGEVVFIASVGEDTYGKAMKKNLRGDGIETRTMQFQSGTSTGSALILIDGKGENSIAVAPGANDLLTLEHLEACSGVLRGSALIVLQREIPEPIIAFTLALAEESKVPTLLNYAPIKATETELCDKISILVVNEIEATALSHLPVGNESEAKAAAIALRKFGIKTVIITLGASGSWVCAEDFEALIPAFPVKPLDTTAAGDTYCGAFAAAFVEGKSLPESVRFASAAAAISVTRLGAQPSIPTRAEIDAFLTKAQAE